MLKKLKSVQDLIGKLSAESDGSALIYVMILSIIFSSTLSVIFLYSRLQTEAVNLKARYLQCRYNAWSSAVLRSREIEEMNSFTDFRKWDSRVQQTPAQDSCRIASFTWGGFTGLFADANRKTVSYHLELILGRKIHDTLPAVITSPAAPVLVLTGNSLIRGNILAGPQGVRKSRLRQTKIPAGTIIQGKILASDVEKRPMPDSNRIRIIYSRLEDYGKIADKPWNSYESADENIVPLAKYHLSEIPVVSVSNSDINGNKWDIRGPGILCASEPLIIRRPVRVSNYIILSSKYPIVIDGPVSLEDVILFSSQTIEIKQVTHFSGQLFAVESIRIHEGMKLDYPSLLMILASHEDSFIRLAAGTVVSGWVIHTFQAPQTLPHKEIPNIQIEKGALINGVVYSDHTVELSGSVHGSVITDHFIASRAGTVYINWIIDGKIDNNFRKDYRILPEFLGSRMDNLHIIRVK